MAFPFGKYQLLKRLASGGMGQVFLARAAGAQGFEKLLVIKRILPHLVEDEEFIQMFFDEARLTARLNHPNIVQIFDLGEVAGSHYLAMEYVDGEDLRRVDREARAQGKAIPLGPLCRIIADAAGGLDHAHRARDAQGQPLELIHRDVSPQNILVGFDGGVKLIDFGVAKAAGRAHRTDTGILKGKYAYMSPEQVDGKALDRRSDIFSLGIVFWELLTGRRLFKADADVETMRLVRECNVTPPSRVNGVLPAALDPLVMLALTRDRTRRFPDAGAFRMAIEDFAVAQQLPASSTHLTAFMREVYAKRLEQGRTPATFDELGPTDVLDEPPLTSQRTEPERPRGATVPIEQVSFWRSLRFGAVVAAAAALATAGVVLALPRLRGPSSGEAPPGARPVQPLTLTLTSNPSGARVQLDGRDVGRTPVSITAAPDGSAMIATFSMPGFDPVETAVTARNAPLFSVQLKRRNAAPAKAGR
jgi:eukaryotic-like serine/threonine-protein kinase